MTEQILLTALLGLAFILAPLMTRRFFLENSRSYSILHVLALTFLLVSLVTGAKSLVIAWPLFCAIGLTLYLNKQRALIVSVKGLASCLPFVFSLISSLWFTAGVLDWRLLGYDQTWSFYAALHGSFLGWLFVGCLAYLSKTKIANRPYLYGCYLVFICFLLVAFGIDGVPVIKRVGVIGLSFAVPSLIALYTFTLDKGNAMSLRLASLSLGAIAYSMTYAVLREFLIIEPRTVFGLPAMVMVHGILNAAVVVPFFYFAIRFEQALRTKLT